MKLLLSLTLSLVGLVSCSQPTPRNVLLITVDTTRADALDPAGPNARLSPNVGALASSGVYYANAHTVAPITLPSHSSMLTGLVPPRHSVRLNGTQSLPDEAFTLAELARESGYETSAFLGAVVLNGEYGLAQGFDHYGHIGPVGLRQQSHYVERPANEVVDATLAWMSARDRTKPFFSWVHVFDAHMPYQPPAEHLRAAGGNTYLGEVAFLDAELGRLFDALRADGSWEDTVVLLVADHGEALGEHGEATHGTCGYEGTLLVPMVLVDPDSSRRGRNLAPVSVVDVFPTLADAMGNSAPASVDGVNLRDGDPPKDRGVYVEAYFGTHSYGWAPLAGWIKSGWKLLQSSESELYHLTEDPTESRNLIDAAGMEERTRALRRELAQVFERDALSPQAAQTDPEVLKRLQGLGYVGMEQPASEFPNPFEPTSKPSPHSQTENLLAFQAAQNLAEALDHERAVAILQPLVERAPFNGAAWRLLAGELIHLNRYAEGLAAAEKNFEIQGDWWGARVNLGVALEGLGRLEEAIPHYEAAVAKNPDVDRILSRLANIYLKRGDKVKAAGYLGILRENLRRRGEWPPKDLPVDGGGQPAQD